MTQEWAMAAGEQEHLEELTEKWERKFRQSFPALIALNGRDFFDDLWSADLDDDERAAFDEAAATVAAELANAYTFGRISHSNKTEES